MSTPVRIRVTDPITGDSEEGDIQRGDYCLTVVEPCYLDGIQTYSNGTVVLTLKNHLGKSRDGSARSSPATLPHQGAEEKR